MEYSKASKMKNETYISSYDVRQTLNTSDVLLYCTNVNNEFNVWKDSRCLLCATIKPSYIVICGECAIAVKTIPLSRKELEKKIPTRLIHLYEESLDKNKSTIWMKFTDAYIQSDSIAYYQFKDSYGSNYL